MSDKLKLFYFARLREGLGVEAEEIDLPPDVRDIAGLMAWLAARGGEWQHEFAGCRLLRAAINHELAANDAPIANGDEIAFFPPVTGG